MTLQSENYLSRKYYKLDIFLKTHMILRILKGGDSNGKEYSCNRDPRSASMGS